MRLSKTFMHFLRGVFAVSLVSIASGASAQGQFVQPHPLPPKTSAQTAKPPAGLQWQWMDKVYFNPIKGYPDASSPEERSLMSQIWAKEIKTLQSPGDNSPMLGTALSGSVVNDGIRVLMTMFNSFNSNCIQPGNGRGMYDNYATCPLRLIRFNADNRISQQDLPVQFCMLDGLGTPDDTRAKNHIEYGFDQRSGLVFFRTIQYGEIVPACNRALRIF
jgi:hypothetical protein